MTVPSIATAMFGSPRSSLHQVSRLDLQAVLEQLQTMAGTNGALIGFAGMRENLDGIPGAADGKYAAVLTEGDDGGVWLRTAGEWAKVAALPLVLTESLSARLARAFANAGEAVEVDPVLYPGEYSSRHWALQASTLVQAIAPLATLEALVAESGANSTVAASRADIVLSQPFGTGAGVASLDTLTYAMPGVAAGVNVRSKDGTIHRVAETDAADPDWTGSAGSLKTYAMPVMRRAALGQFGPTLLNGGGDDSALLARAITVAAARGIKELVIGGTASIASLINLTGLDLDLELIGGTWKYAGAAGLIQLNSCTGSLQIKGATIDGQGRAASQPLIYATDDAGLDLAIEGGSARDIGSSALGAARLLQVFRAQGKFERYSVYNAYSRGGNMIAMGHGRFGLVRFYAEHVDGNVARLGRTGSGNAEPCENFIDDFTAFDVDDSFDGSGPYGNALSAFKGYGYRCRKLRIERVFASGFRGNQSEGMVDDIEVIDTGLVAIYDEFGSSNTKITRAKVYGSGTQGIVSANPEDIPDGRPETETVTDCDIRHIGYKQHYSDRALPASFPGGAGTAYARGAADLPAWAISTAYVVGDARGDAADDTLWRCVVAHTSAAAGTFADDRTANPTYWEQCQPGRNRAHGVTLNFGLGSQIYVADVNGCTTRESVCFSSAAQNFNLKTKFKSCEGHDADYLCGFGLSNSKTHSITFDDVSGTYRRAPFAALGGSYLVYAAATMASGSGHLVFAYNMDCPRAERPANMGPGSRLRDPATGDHYTWIGTGSVTNGTPTGAWSDSVLSGAADVAVNSVHAGRLIRCTKTSGTQTITLGSAPIGAKVRIRKVGAATVAIAADGIVTGITSLTTAMQTVTAECIFTSTWEVS